MGSGSSKTTVTHTEVGEKHTVTVVANNKSDGWDYQAPAPASFAGFSSGLFTGSVASKYLVKQGAFFLSSSSLHTSTNDK
jgi:hypothetical protein